ncbi:MAG: hypothetical protein ACREPI_11105 [Candidatus Dormibacterales bacterium]
MLLPLIGAATLAAITAAPAAAADEGAGGAVYLMTAQGPTRLDHARAFQDREEGSIRISLHTHGLVPGSTPTVLVAIFNSPHRCNPSGEPIAICDPSNLGNPASHPSEIQLTGGTVTPSGRFSFHTTVKVGDTSGVLAGPGLTNLRGAEIQVVMFDGPVIEFGVLEPSRARDGDHQD